MRLTQRLGAILATVLVLSVGLIVLLSLLVTDDMGTLSTLLDNSGLRQLASILIRIVFITVALTIFIGFFNLIGVHVRRVVQRDGGWLNSLVLVISFIATIFLHLIYVKSPAPNPSTLLLEDVQIAIESSLAALLFFALVYGAYRVLAIRMSWGRVLFLISMLVVLAGAVPLIENNPFTTMSQWLQTIPVNAGIRGILIGIALASIVAGIRVLIGQDRSYRE